VCGIKLPKGLLESSKLEEPIFTPATKAEVGLHDENIILERMEKIVGKDLARQLKSSLGHLQKARDLAEQRGIIIAIPRWSLEGKMADFCLLMSS
jgi:phosphoribosylaminoimidazole-succinocarboxamide synthase